MAAYHCHCKVIGRAQGRSAIGASAYRSGEKLANEYDGITHDYTKKSGIVHNEIMLCDNAPQEYMDRSTLWNAVEKSENNSRARLAREYEISLPIELSRDEQIQLTRGYVQGNFVKKGMCADITIHDKKDGNPHAHIMLTMRPIDEKGKWEAKKERIYICKNMAGEERGFTAQELKAQKDGEWEKQLPYYKDGNSKSHAIYLTKYEAETGQQYKDYSRVKGKNDPKSERAGRPNPKITEWDSSEFLVSARKDLADRINHEFEQKNISQRVDHRSYEAQGINKIPTQHIGASAMALERKGIKSDRGNENREINNMNVEMTKLDYQSHQFRNEIICIRDDIRWNRTHENMANLETRASSPLNVESGAILLQIKNEIEQLQEHARNSVASEASKGRTVNYDSREIPYHGYHKNKVIGDGAYILTKITQNLAEIERQRREAHTVKLQLDRQPPTRTAAEEAKEPPRRTQEINLPADERTTLDASKVALKLVEHRAAFVKATEQNLGPKTYQENIIYKQQATQIIDLARRVNDQTTSIKGLQTDKNQLGFFQGKEKKALQGKIDSLERSRRANIEKLKELGVSDPSYAEKVAKEKNVLAEQERAKVQETRKNQGADIRAAEAKKAFLDLADSVPEDMLPVVSEKVEEYRALDSNDNGKKGDLNLKRAQAEVAARRELDPALKRQRDRSQTNERNKEHDR